MAFYDLRVGLPPSATKTIQGSLRSERRVGVDGEGEGDGMGERS